MNPSAIPSRVHAMRHAAQGIVTLDLRPLDGAALPAFSAGAHIDLCLAEGLVRSYSLCNDSEERHRYVVGVLKDAASRGGSRHVHERVRVNEVLNISAPRNHFALHEVAAHSVLVAGGIGITPILCMGRRLKRLGRSAEIVYACRSRQSAAFLPHLEALQVPLTLHFDDEKGGPPDLRALLARRAPESSTHHYACGPAVMLDAFVRACTALGHPHAHIERFQAAAPPPVAPQARSHFTVELRRSAQAFEVTPEKSLARHLIERKIDVPFSCGEGICGSCETRVLEGEPDHRDSLLSEKERASNRIMLPCVSGCRGERLVLDL
ncbi:PDR/VanB family oxidoreductase [Hydrogenophaga sp. BPS33]|uniref:PDR/VanB family oxidoreductase n=1 Tax=Hydrogenophaga sp. BPS33 TaxID=2651974 RepID=UPI0013204A71|nr:PDR/VanB family oxidoreductase [Hydrogenophaga sp. BPS33]QHE83521.1 oxidoreductase [Hydrogenophaga sp. BPS33]